MGRYGVGVTPLVGVFTSDGVITKKVGELFAGAVVLVGEFNSFKVGVGVAVTGRNVGTGEGAGVNGFCVAWFKASKPTAIKREKEPVITYQRDRAMYFRRRR